MSLKQRKHFLSWCSILFERTMYRNPLTHSLLCIKHLEVEINVQSAHFSHFSEKRGQRAGSTQGPQTAAAGAADDILHGGGSRGHGAEVADANSRRTGPPEQHQHWRRLQIRLLRGRRRHVDSKVSRFPFLWYMCRWREFSVFPCGPSLLRT